MKRLFAYLILALSISSIYAQTEDKPIVLKTMGSLLYGGTVTHKDNGGTFHGDHGYAQYYIPENSYTYPIILWHGIGQSGKSYETTPDGREGFQAILPRRGWSTYIIDQPRRGRAGYTNAPKDEEKRIPTTEDESGVWNAFRIGTWTEPQKPDFHSTLQFPETPGAVDQFFRQQTPNTGEEPVSAEHRSFMGQSMASLLAETGPSILVTHSHSGQYGWAAGCAAPELIKAIIAFEPGSFAFPNTEIPDTLESIIPVVNEIIKPQLVPMNDFMKLTQFPILIIYGDNIPSEPTNIYNNEVWRIASGRAKQFVDAINRHGGDAKLIILPDLGIKGNTHAPFADLNNLEIADVFEGFLKQKGLDDNKNPHQGPKPKNLKEFTIPVTNPR